MTIGWWAVFARQVMHADTTAGAIPFTAFTLAMFTGHLLIGRAKKKYHISELSKLGGIGEAVAMALGVWVAPPLFPVNPVLGIIVLTAFWAVSGFGLAPMLSSFFGAAGHVRGLTTTRALSQMSLDNALTMVAAKIFLVR